MIRPHASLLVLVLALTACEVVVPAMVLHALFSGAPVDSEAPVDPLQIPRAPLPPEERERGTVLLVVPTDVGKATVAAGTTKVRVGAIVDQAVRTAFEGVLRDGLWIGELPAASPGADAIVRIEAVRLAYRERRLESEWKAGELIQSYESRATLAFDLKVSDAAGRLVRSHAYEDDDGRFVWTIPSETPAPAMKWLQSHVHEAAGRLAQQAAADLHRWLRAERMKPLSL